MSTQLLLASNPSSADPGFFTLQTLTTAPSQGSILPGYYSTIFIESNQTTLGAGVLLSPDGYFVTNVHVLEKQPPPGAPPVPPGKPIDLKDINIPQFGFKYSVKVVAFNRSVDFALLKVTIDEPHAPLPCVSLETQPLTKKDRLWKVGFPAAAQRNNAPQSDGISKRISHGIYIMTSDSGILVDDSDLREGMSGGAVLNDRGNLVGISVSARNSRPTQPRADGAKLSNENIPLTNAPPTHSFSIDISHFKPYLDDLDIHCPTQEIPPALPLTIPAPKFAKKLAQFFLNNLYEAKFYQWEAQRPGHWAKRLLETNTVSSEYSLRDLTWALGVEWKTNLAKELQSQFEYYRSTISDMPPSLQRLYIKNTLTRSLLNIAFSLSQIKTNDAAKRLLQIEVSNQLYSHWPEEWFDDRSELFSDTMR